MMIGDYKFQVLAPAIEQPLSLNTQINDSLASGFERALYRFDGTPGQRFYFDSLAEANGSWNLYGPDNQSIANPWLGSDFEVTLSSTGSYTLMVNGYNANTVPVNYSFKVITSPTTIQSLNFNTPITGEIALPGETDVFTFIGTSGTKLYYDALEGDYDSINAKLVSPSGSSIFNTNSDNNSNLINLAETGTYRLIFDGSGPTTGDYKFQMLAPGLNAGQNLSTPVTARLDSRFHTALYQFNGTAGTRLLFDSLASADGNWSLYGPDNQSIYSTSLGYDFERTLPLDGSYTLMINSYSGTPPAVNYSFQVSGPTAIVTSNSVAPSNSSTQLLSLNSPITGSISSGSERDIFTFSGTPGQQIYFDALEAPDYDNIYVNLVSPSGNLIFNGSSDSDSNNLIALTESGTYSLAFYSYYGTNTGDYKFQVLAPAIEQPLSLNTQINDSLASGFERALYRFDGTPGQRFYFDSLAEANGSWHLYSPTNQIIGSNSLSSDFEVTLTNAGSYTLMLFGNNYSDNSVNYNFKVTTPPTNILALNLNALVTGEIAVPREVDKFTFKGTAGTTLYYDALEADGDNILATLVTPSGNNLLSRHNTDNDSSSPGLFTLTETGTYHLIFNADYLTTGDYKFQLLAASPSDRLSLNQTVENQLTSPQQTVLYQFNGTAGQRVSFAPVSSLRFGTAAEASATARSITNGGGDEDGYAAIDAAISHNGFRPAAAKNAILITDEDRDAMNANLNFGNILNALNAKDVLLNVAVNANFANSNNGTALGVDANGNAYTANGAGGYLFSGGGRVVPTVDTTKQDYIDLAHANGGVAWDLNQLRAGGQTATSFSNAFVNQLQQQIESQLALDVISSDSSAGFQNLTGTLSGITGGETATFNAKFTGNGETRAFDLLFKRPDSNAILGSIPVTINANTTYFYPVQAIDADGDSLTYSLTAAPASASIDSSTGRISWKPPAAGNYEFTVKVADAKGGIATQTYSVNVTAGGNNNNPEITSTNLPTATVGQPYTYKLTATDADDDRLSYYLINPPQGAAIDKDTGVFTWTPSQATAGQDLTVRVLDGRGGKATRTFTIPVSAAAPNDAPAINSNPGTRATVSQLYRYDAVATDPNADNVRFDLVLKPEGMTVDAQRGTLVWQPTPEQVGDHTVVLRASDGRGGVDLQSFVVRVGLPNSAPEIASTPVPSAIVNRPYQYQVLATDADGDNLSYRLQNPPSGMTIDSKGILKWTPNSLGTPQVNIIVSDGSAETTQTFNLNVLASAPNSNPEITSTPRKVIGLGQNYFYQVTATDANSDPLTYSLVSPPDGMTIDERGRIFWQPKSNQFGNNNVKVRVTDGVGGEAIQEFAINVRSQPTNNHPKIDSTPQLNATVGKQYRYDLTGNDPENDVLLWSLDKAPTGMSINPEKGTILWTPKLDQIGDNEVAVRVTDAFGAYIVQEFTLSVRGVNVAPNIISSPPTVAAVNKVYKYAVLASDFENDALTYSLVNPPEEMTIERETGLIEWTPNAEQLGSKDVEVVVEDSFGGKVSQKYTVVVSSTAANLPPAITSTPVYAATTNQLYRYNVTANDPEGENLQYGLIKFPPGMTINSTTGVLEWTPASVGEFEVVVGATDASGKGGAQQFWVTVAANNPPVITSTPPGAIAKGKTYQYDVRAFDPNGDALSYTLNNPPQGMTIDKLGRIRWSDANPGSYAAEVVVEDTRGARVSQPLSLNVVADTTAPKVNLWSSRLGDVQKGDEVTFVVNATDDVGVESVSLLVNGTRVALDGQGRATVAMNSAGVVQAIAQATDVSGNTSSTSNTLRVIDGSDEVGPVLEIPEIADGEFITAPINIIGTVNDGNESNLLYYTLKIAPVGSEQFTEIFRGTTPVTNGILGTFDPRTVANDAYILKFEAHDAGGNVSSVEQVVNVETEFKLGNLQLSYTDLEIPLSGIPIKVTRIYDSLDATRKENFGYGWRLDFRDTDLRTTVPPDLVAQETGYYTVPFEEGTRVYLNVPGGKREVFTFKPVLDETSRFLAQYRPDDVDGGLLYRPAFESMRGSTNKLTVRNAYITKVGNEYHGLNGEPYNPENPAFGRVYVLTTAEGIVYEIDAVSGDLLTATAPNGTQLTYSDDGIFSNTGVSIPFGRNAAGQITSVTAPDGKQIRYEYEPDGDLAAVTNREDKTTQFVYNETDKPHHLIKVIGPDGQVTHHQTGRGTVNRPPVVTVSNSIRTHEDLELRVDLTPFATDPDGDSITFRVANPINGTVRLLEDGKTAVFQPLPGVTGVGSFNLIADDGQGSPTSVPVTVNISDAPLLNLTFVERDLQLDAGESAELTVLGDFADAEDVVLPDSYLTYSADNPGIVGVDGTGTVTPTTDGVGIVKASRDGIQAVTALRVGEIPTPTNDAEFNIALAETMGLDAYPQAITLVAGMKRQLLVGIDEVISSPDLKAASQGTRYFVSNPNVLQVSEDGLITALDEGVTEVTIVHGAAEEVVPVRVVVPLAGSATLGIDGGAVRAADGAMVLVPEGALNEDTAVSIGQLRQDQLSLSVPEKFAFAGAFRLDVGDEPLNLPVQLAIPAPAGLAPGTEVFFMRKGELPVTQQGGEWVGTDTLHPIWTIEESGVVGADGMIRTASPPWQGAFKSGEYSIAVPNFQYSEARFQFALATGFVGAGFLGLGVAMIASPTLAKLSRFTYARPDVTVPRFLFSLGAEALWTVPALIDASERSITALTIPKVGLPYTTTTGVELNLAQLDSGRIPTVEINLPTGPVPSTQPLIERVELQLDEQYGRVVSLEGKNFGSNVANDQLSVSFVHGGKEYLGQIIEFTPINEERTRIKAITNLVPLNGDESQIVIKRKTRSPINTETEEESERVKLPKELCVEVALLPKAGSDSVSLINALNPEQVIAQSAEGSLDLLLGDIPVGTGNNNDDRPEFVAATSNAARAYVTLSQSSRVAVVDIAGLQQLDTKPDLEGINPINLPDGAKPGAIVIGAKDQYAYVADQRVGNIYVLDINPFSPHYNKCIGTIEVEDAPKGFRQMAVNSDRTRLFLTAPNSTGAGKGQILVFNIDPKDRPTNSTSNPRNWHGKVGKVEAGLGVEGISATPNPNQMVFTNRNEDARGFGVLTINNQPGNSSIQTKYAQLSLGSFLDEFDVNEAVAVTVTNDGNYAFVAARNGRLLGSGIDSIDGPKAGGNIGIIKNPLTNPKLVAATRPIPMGLTSGLALSSDNKYLTATYPGIESTLVFDVEEIIQTVESADPDLMQQTPIDELNPNISIAADLKDISNPIDRLFNKIPFGVPAGSKRGPLNISGQPSSAAMASSRSEINMVNPVGVSNEETLRPTFSWTFDDQEDVCASPIDEEDIEEVNLYVSVFPEGEGLLPDDRWEWDMNSDKDYNPNRILTATWDDGTWTWTGGAENSVSGSPNQFRLPEDRMLTAGQKYYWAVEVKYNDGRVNYVKKNQSFEIELPSIAHPRTFSSVTVLTRGLEREGYKIDSHFYEIADHITRKIGPIDPGGLVMRYDSDTGNWLWRNSNSQWVEGPIPEDKFGAPLVLIPGWEKYPEETAYNSGFAEAKADALFASLVDLNQDLGSDALFNSRTHFVGVGQGAVINSEIVQRLGTFFPKNQHPIKFPDLQMTTVDPHDFNQDSLNGRLGSVNDPVVTVWENVTFADNYYQGVEDQNTLNGREINEADLNKPLNNWAGFTSNDSSGSLHRNTLAWYAGTAHLNKSKLPSENGDLIYRRLDDLERYNSGSLNNSNALTWYTPDHTGANFDHGDENAPWEGIGTGWFYSVLGGGYGNNVRPASNLNQRVRLYEDNTALARMRGDFAVPTLFNGNFDAISERLPQQSIPGWSFYNGGNEVSQQYLENFGTADNPNYALQLGNGLTEFVHNRFVVPDWGALRFNLHVPNANGGRLRVFMRGSEPGEQWQPLTTIRSRVNNTVLRRDSVELVQGTYEENPGEHEPNQIGFGIQGFETFHFDVPDNLRGRVATLRFQLEGNTAVYLDDVFFKSVHLKLGNPTLTDLQDGVNQQEARFDPFNHANNYLIEKPQYALSYNNRERGPNWVSYQLNRAWIGNTLRAGEPWQQDPQLLPPLQGTQGDNYSAGDGTIHRGHMVTRSHRNRNLKDQQATFYTTSMLPQHRDNNSDFFQSAWVRLENYAREQLVVNDNRELYIISGGYGSQNGNFDHNHPLNVNNINYPGYTWKAIVVLDPGQSVTDITENTRVIAVATPNIARPPGQTPEERNAWQDWGNWRVSVDDIEMRTGLNLLSNIPREIQDQIEARVDSGPTS